MIEVLTGTADIGRGTGPVRALGLMSGTSMDGIDLAVITTDGLTVDAFGPVDSAAFAPEVRAVLREAVAAGACIPKGERPDPATRALWEAAGSAVTRAHEEAIRAFAREHHPALEDISVIGFHGQTVLHRPEEGWTVQLGDGAGLARALGRTVVGAFRQADLAAGGQGAPLAPLYHRALAVKAGLPEPMVVVNIGGVSNITWIGTDGRVAAFDTGPGNAPIDDWVRAITGADMDEDGQLARSGRVDEAVLARMLDRDWFDRPPPKSLDRLDFGYDAVAGLAPEDGAATLTAFTAEAIRRGADHLPAVPLLWVICGGGRKNAAVMEALEARLPGRVVAAEAMGWRGDDIEAQAFAYLAVRALRGLPLSLPETTGVPAPCPGGEVFVP
ncbi:MAG: anhydro-N-acetylmuramic acid kinase [Alphaproteobacteria bacterium]